MVRAMGFAYFEEGLLGAADVYFSGVGFFEEVGFFQGFPAFFFGRGFCFEGDDNFVVCYFAG